MLFVKKKTVATLSLEFAVFLSLHYFFQHMCLPGMVCLSYQNQTNILLQLYSLLLAIHSWKTKKQNQKKGNDRMQCNNHPRTHSILLIVWKWANFIICNINMLLIDNNHLAFSILSTVVGCVGPAHVMRECRMEDGDRWRAMEGEGERKRDGDRACRKIDINY